MDELIQAGLLEDGELLIWTRPRSGDFYEAHVTAGGRFVTSDGQVFKSPTGAANHVAGGSHNGWAVWSVPRLDGISLDAVRQDYEGS